MLSLADDSVRAILTGLFWDPFDAAHAITDLVGGGFSEDEIDAIGVLCGPAPDLTDWLFSMGLERQEAIFYNDCFADGATLLIVCTERGHRARLALETLRRHMHIVRLRQQTYEARSRWPAAMKKRTPCITLVEKLD